MKSLNSPKVSVIIPCYNQGHFLHDAIRSCLLQTYPNVEIIVVNDGSTDSTASVADFYRGKVELLTIPNCGLSTARNTGVRQSSGSYIVCLDADDKLHPEYIERLMIEDADIVCSGTQEFGLSDRMWKTSLKQVTYQHLIERNRLNYAALYKREVWLSVGGYDTNMKIGFEDYMFWLDAAKLGHSIMVINEFMFHYRKHDRSMFSEAQKRRNEILCYMSIKHGLNIGGNKY